MESNLKNYLEKRIANLNAMKETIEQSSNKDSFSYALEALKARLDELVVIEKIVKEKNYGF